MGIGETGVGEMGVGETETPCSNEYPQSMSLKQR